MLGRSGGCLLAVFAIAAAGTGLTAIVGAAAAAIPFADFLIAMPLSIFPTLLLYLGAIATIYLPLTVVMARGRDISRKLQIYTLATAIFIVGVAAVLIPEYWNRTAGVQAPSGKAGTTWKPLKASDRGSIGLVSQGQFWPVENVCDSFCLALLVTQRAGEVIVGRTKSMPPPNPIDARSVRLRPDWRACFSKLPDYSFQPRSQPEARLDYFPGLLGHHFAGELKQCLLIKPVELDLMRQVTLINWHDPHLSPQEEEAGVGVGPIAGVQRIVRPGKAQDSVRYLRLGRRYVVPAFLWPYAGNAGSGGRFELSWATSFFSTIPGGEQSAEAWWTMVSDGDQLAKDAVSLLDATVSDQRRTHLPSTG